MVAVSRMNTSPTPTPERGTKVLVVGLGTSGYWCARYMAHRGCAVTVSEMRYLGEPASDQVSELRQTGVMLETGGHQKETFLNTDVIVVSPGVPLDMYLLRMARSRHIPVMGELELASRFIKDPIIAVTGTNGKSTVTALIGHILQTAGIKAFVGGNIGTPLMAYPAQGARAEYLVVEVSSFQLDTAQTFHPAVSVILNISPDHLDRYPTYDAYAASKLRIFENQGPGDYLIVNDEDPVLSSISPPRGVQCLKYGPGQKKGRAASVRGKTVAAGLKKGHEKRFSTENWVLPGRHNVANLLAAVLAAQAVGVGPDHIQTAMDTFRGLPHRTEYVGRCNRIEFYNDSKATNVDAAIRAVTSFERPVILIAGGRHKGADYGALVSSSVGRAKGAVFLGEAKDLLAHAFDYRIPFCVAEGMEDALLKAFGMAAEGDVVLLAPACSSFDMFSDYTHRGRVFKACVRRLIQTETMSDREGPESGVVNG